MLLISCDAGLQYSVVTLDRLHSDYANLAVGKAFVTNFFKRFFTKDIPQAKLLLQCTVQLPLMF